MQHFSKKRPLIYSELMLTFLSRFKSGTESGRLPAGGRSHVIFFDQHVG